MDLIDELKALSARISKQRELIESEEATKNAFVMPFIRALGYDVFDPTEVIPDFTTDVDGEKVDYAILKDGKPIILFECEWCGIELGKDHQSQLEHCFNVTDARFAVLTNGVIYRFYADIEEPNKMDSKPFLELNMLDLGDSAVEDLKSFSKSFFDLDENLTAAMEAKYTREIQRVIAAQFANPSEMFVRFFAAQVYSGQLSETVQQQFTDWVKNALQLFLNDDTVAVSENAQADMISSVVAAEVVPDNEADLIEADGDSGLVKTDAEMEGLQVIRDILKEIVEPERVVVRETSSYYGILFDDNNRKPICRLRFSKKKRLGLFNENKVEEKFLIENVDDISQYADQLIDTVRRYLQD
ncbi:MAG: restriction endonuclease [Pseudomonadota bacterium]